MDKIQLSLEREILSFLSQRDSPVGAVQLSVLFGRKFGVSQATIGRKLFQMDYEGYTKKMKKMGRCITDKGLKYLNELDQALKQEEVWTEFMNALKSVDIQGVIDILVARRGLERESAFLAAKNADEKDIHEMEDVLKHQLQIITEKSTGGDDEDRNFHRLIAEASKNNVLVKAITLIREQNTLALHLATIRKMIGGNIYHDHEQILDRIKAKDSEGASRAMETHINNMIKEFKNYELQFANRESNKAKEVCLDD
jgi:GntR family L-lactate dehydrogenase operon transcriptional regulator